MSALSLLPEHSKSLVFGSGLRKDLRLLEVDERLLEEIIDSGCDAGPMRTAMCTVHKKHPHAAPISIYEPDTLQGQSLSDGLSDFTSEQEHSQGYGVTCPRLRLQSEGHPLQKHQGS